MFMFTSDRSRVRGESLLDDLLDQIYEGKISLMNAPPPAQTDKDKVAKWSTAQIGLLVLNQRGILEYCLKERKEHCPPVVDAATLSIQTMRSMSSMQLHPTVMDNVRRFVVIQADDAGTSDHGV